MRACEGCRRRKIKCDAATTNTWPCSACVRLKLHCVRPNGFDESDSPTTSTTLSDPSAGVTTTSNPNSHPMYDASGRMFSNPATGAHETYTPQSMMQGAAKAGAQMYQPNQLAAGTPDLFQAAQYGDARPAAQQNIAYAGMPRDVNAVDSSYASQTVFPAASLQTESQQHSSPGAYSQDSYQTDLADLLGSLKVNEAGTGKNNTPPFQSRFASGRPGRAYILSLLES